MQRPCTLYLVWVNLHMLLSMGSQDIVTDLYCLRSRALGKSKLWVVKNFVKAKLNYSRPLLEQNFGLITTYLSSLILFAQDSWLSQTQLWWILDAKQIFVWSRFLVKQNSTLIKTLGQLKFFLVDIHVVRV